MNVFKESMSTHKIPLIPLKYLQDPIMTPMTPHPVPWLCWITLTNKTPSRAPYSVLEPLITSIVILPPLRINQDPIRPLKRPIESLSILIKALFMS